MIAYFVLGVGLLLGILLLLKWFVEAEPRDIGRGLLWALGTVGLVLGLVLLWIGRYQLAWIALPALIGLLSRWREVWQAIRSRSRGQGQGQAQAERSSTVETRFLRMTLGHESGVMTGEILEGRLVGQRLEDLSLQDCIALWDEVRVADDESRAVLEAYLDKVYGGDWREAASAGGGPHDAGTGGTGGGGAAGGHGAMTREEARAILGVDADADAETIRAAYRGLMKKLHPDHGGSNYFAMKLNEARRTLLGD